MCLKTAEKGQLQPPITPDHKNTIQEEYYKIQMTQQIKKKNTIWNPQNMGKEQRYK